MSDLDKRGRRMKLAGLVIVGLGSLFFLAMGVGEMAGGDLSGFIHLPPAVVLGALVYLGRRHPFAVGMVLVIIAFGLASLYAIAGDLALGLRIAWALQIALPPLVAAGLLLAASRREGGAPVGSTLSPPQV